MGQLIDKSMRTRSILPQEGRFHQWWHHNPVSDSRKSVVILMEMNDIEIGQYALDDLVSGIGRDKVHHLVEIMELDHDYTKPK